jgi:uncharacterized protein YlxW (UPF0749 family)
MYNCRLETKLSQSQSAKVDVATPVKSVPNQTPITPATTQEAFLETLSATQDKITEAFATTSTFQTNPKESCETTLLGEKDKYNMAIPENISQLRQEIEALTSSVSSLKLENKGLAEQLEDEERRTTLLSGRLS